MNQRETREKPLILISHFLMAADSYSFADFQDVIFLKYRIVSDPNYGDKCPGSNIT